MSELASGRSARPEVFLAIDGGNSKTDVVLADTAGTVLGYARGPGSSPHDLTVAGSAELLDELVRKAVGEVPLPVDRAEVFLAGADLPIEVESLTTALGALGWARELVVDNDTFALMRAGLDADADDPADDGDGVAGAVAVVCGAGINCVGRTSDGRSARFPSLGHISGDWGGGDHIASLALWHAARGEDGRAAPTGLAQAVAAHFGMRTVEDVSIALHLGGIEPDRVGELCPVLFAVAARGDAVALGVVDLLADEIVAMARVAITRLELEGTDVPVVLGGGLLRAGWPLLSARVVAGLQAVAPLVRPRLVDEPPVVGAVLSVLDALAAPADVHAKLRAAVHDTV
ncbi:N-acetylglucosamine kinase [Pseudonocardia sp. TRM90224]|uniref:N-acetylglucosamine kinase n=1 Tax=Pseudonocardia sp. TRM90224 TaxID=2812678 RepID=UPI001E539D81|nr:BadF/BadG/BcrA/BcrD ATPase family protein [Pseudonocardia sp. TRM90224]